MSSSLFACLIRVSERDMQKSMVEALQSIPSARDVANSFYGGVEDESAPIQEVILPFTTSSEEVSLVESYYRHIIVGQETRPPYGWPSPSRTGSGSSSPNVSG